MIYVFCIELKKLRKQYLIDKYIDTILFLQKLYLMDI